MKYKKLLIFVLTLALFWALAGSVQAAPYAEEKCGDNATWQIDGTGTLVISGTGTVTSAPWYDYYRYDFDKVVISEGITALSDQIFRDCSNLQQVTIPVSLTSVGEGCFTGCNSLKTVTYNGTLAQWQKISFRDTSSPLFQAKLICTDSSYNLCGPNVFWILDTNDTLYFTGSGAMSEFSAFAPAPWHSLYSSIKAVTIGDGVTTIGSYAFYNLDSYEPFAMTQITIPKSIVSVGAMAFSDCTLLTDVYYADTYDCWIRLTVGSHNETLHSVTLHCTDRTLSMCGQSTYWELDSHGTLIIAGQGPTANWNGYTRPPWHDQRYNIKKAIACEGVTHVGNHAFDGNYAEEVVLADSVLSIGNYAFENCFLKKITIGSQLVSLGEGAFDGCDYLTAVSLPNTVTSIGKYAFRNCESMETVSLGTGLTTLGKEAFDGCTSLKEAVLPDGVTDIEDCTFLNCTAMTRIALPKNLKTVGKGAFYNCSSLTEIILPDSVTEVGYQAFRYCTSLTEIFIPAGVETFDPDAVEGCSQLAAFRVDKKNPNYASDSTGVLFNKDMTILLRAPQAINGSYQIPATVTELSDQAFFGCANLTHVSIPDSVTRLPDGLFYDCCNLKTATLGRSLTYIGPSAFQGCRALTQIALPESLTTIEMNAFYDCCDLKAISLYNNITYIGSNAFYSCSSLETFTWPAGVPTIKDSTFAYCCNLTKIFLPASVAEIGWDAFEGTALKSVYYAGTRNKWQSVSIDEGNDCLTEATVYYEGESGQNYDLNLDGVLDAEDAVYLLLHTMFGEAFYPLNGTSADVDSSGMVDQNDAVYLLLHTMFGDAFYPLNTSALPIKIKE